VAELTLADILPAWKPGMPLPAPAGILDAGQGECCPGARVTPLDCTCWTPVYDLEQQPPAPGTPPVAGTARMCGDCAYRPRSPERQGDPGVKGDAAALDQLAAGGTPFWCHQGMRRPVRWVHPSGAELPGSPADYRPPVAGGIPRKADGTPGDLCRGWLLRRMHALAAAGG
jgi:hypothetical protein